MSNPLNQLDLAGSQLGQTIGGLTPFAAAQSTDQLAALRPATQRVVWLVTDAAGTVDKIVTLNSTGGSPVVGTVKASGSPTEIAQGATSAEFATNIVTWANTGANLANSGATSIAVHDSITNVVVVTYPAGVAAESIVNTTDDPHLGIGPPTIIVAGAGTAAVDGTYTLDTTQLYNGRVGYLASGSVDAFSDGALWDSDAQRVKSGSATQYLSTDDVLSPDLATTWAADAGALPVPTVTSGSPGADAVTGSLAKSQLGGGGGTTTVADAAARLALANSIGQEAYQSDNGFFYKQTADDATQAGSWTPTPKVWDAWIHTNASGVVTVDQVYRNTLDVTLSWAVASSVPYAFVDAGGGATTPNSFPRNQWTTFVSASGDDGSAPELVFGIPDDLNSTKDVIKFIYTLHEEMKWMHVLIENYPAP